MRKGASGSPFWLLLILAAPALAAIVVSPPFGSREQGWLAEMIGGTLARTREFASFAQKLRFWATAVFALSLLLGMVYWGALRTGWRRRLLTFKPARVSSYRTFVFMKMAWASAFAAAFCGALLFLSSGLKAMELPGWIIMAVGCAALAALQFFTAVWGFSDTRRLYRGH